MYRLATLLACRYNCIPSVWTRCGRPRLPQHDPKNGALGIDIVCPKHVRAAAWHGSATRPAAWPARVRAWVQGFARLGKHVLHHAVLHRQRWLCCGCVACRWDTAQQVSSAVTACTPRVWRVVYYIGRTLTLQGLVKYRVRTGDTRAGALPMTVLMDEGGAKAWRLAGRAGQGRHVLA